MVCGTAYFLLEEGCAYLIATEDSYLYGMETGVVFFDKMVHYKIGNRVARHGWEPGADRQQVQGGEY